MNVTKREQEITTDGIFSPLQIDKAAKGCGRNCNFYLHFYGIFLLPIWRNLIDISIKIDHLQPGSENIWQ